MTSYLEIKPTFLMVKKHTKTGLLYFCKTTRSKDKAIKYKGSGVRWQKHIKQHGGDVVTVWISELYTDTRIKDVAINFSLMHDIVNSSKWANLVIEDGLYGGSTKWCDDRKKYHRDRGTYKKSTSTRMKISDAMGGSHPEKWKSNQQGPGKGKYNKTNEHKMKIKKTLTKLTASQIYYLDNIFTGKRGEKSTLARKWGVNIDQITRWVGNSFKHKKEFV